MARVRTVPGSVTAGVATVIGQLAAYYRLGPYGSVQYGQRGEPGRERLKTPLEIVQKLIERGELPTTETGPRASRSYLCTWVDVETGEVYGHRRVQVETGQATAAIVATTEARRQARLTLPRCVNAVLFGAGRIKMTCRQLGKVVLLPAAG